MQGLLQPNLKELDLCGMKKIKSMVVNSYYQDVGSVINLKLVMPLKKNILKIYCNVLFLLMEWIFCYWDTQFYLHFEHLNKKTTIPECSFFLIHVLFENGTKTKKGGVIIILLLISWKIYYWGLGNWGLTVYPLLKYQLLFTNKQNILA